MSSKLSLFLLVVVILSSSVLGADLKSYSVSESDSLCPGTTGLYVDAIENIGSSPIQVTVSTSGTSSGFATAVPQGFTLSPHQVKFIYTYVTPRSTTPQGTYSLQVSANSERLSHTINIQDCFKYSLDLLTSEQNICPGEQTNYQFEVQNDGEYTDTYNLRLEGPYSSQVSLSDSQFSLNPGQSKTIQAQVSSEATDSGKKEFTLVVDPNLGSSIRTQGASVNIDQCYDFMVTSDTNFVSMCESSEQTIPVVIKNDGSTDNIYDLSLDGPAWVNLETATVSVPANSEKTVNIKVTPEYGIQGNFQAKLISKPRLGTLQAETTFNVQVNKCHDISVSISRDSDAICNSLANNYEVLVQNNGEFAEEYNLEISGPEWASLDSSTLSLDSGEEKSLDLTINPSFTTVPGTYPIEVKATAKDSSKVSASDKILITTVSREDCYKPKLEPTKNNIEVSYDTSATIPIAIENIGASKATYSLSVSGTAANFAYLNPAALEIEQGKSEIVYLYVAPTSQVANGKYTATISVRLEDSTILESDTITISVTESKVDVNAGQEKTSVWSSITGFFAKLFSGSSKTNTNETTEETNESMIELNNSNEMEETDNEQTNEQEQEQQEQTNEDEVMESNETESNATSNATTAVGTGFATALSNSFKSAISFTGQQKITLIIILVLIILILLIIRTGFHKKIGKFFEEEQIEEEQQKIETSSNQEPSMVKEQKTEKKEVHKEETKKETKEHKDHKEDKKDKKEEKKKEPEKPIDDDEDEVIIEFDDD